MELKRIAADPSKHVFTLHGIDAADRAVLRRDVERSQFEAFFAKLPPTDVVLEACGGPHHRGRRLAHRVRLVPPQHVKPFVKRGKNDRIDAEAICEAAGRRGMRFVPIEWAERQAPLMLLKARGLLVRQRTQSVAALRGHATEYGLVAAQGIGKVGPLLAKVAAEAAIPPPAREATALLGREIAQRDERVAALDAELLALHTADPLGRLPEGCRGSGRSAPSPWR